MNEKEDLLLRNSAEQARDDIEAQDRARFGARWDDYAAGRLSAEEAALLIAASEDPETALAASLFTPFDEQVKASFVERLQREARPLEAPIKGVFEGNLGEPEAPANPEAESQEAQRGTLARLWSWLGNGLMFEGKPRLGPTVGVMAGLLFMLSLPLLRQDVEGLPPFALKLQGIQEQRSATGGAGDVFRVGHRFNFLLRPDQKVAGPIVTTVFVQDPAGGLQRWRDAETAVERSSDGAVFSKGLTWPWGDGEWTVHLLLTRNPLQEEDLQLILLEQTAGAGDPLKSDHPSLEKGRWVRERIYVEP